MNTFSQSQRKIDNKIDPSYIICTICAIVMGLIILGSVFAKALDRNEASCNVHKVASNSNHPNQQACPVKEI